MADSTTGAAVSGDTNPDDDAAAATTTTRVMTGVRHLVDRGRGLLVMGGIGLALRLYMVLVARPTCDRDAVSEGCRAVAGDSLYFFQQGKALAQGFGYVDPRRLFGANELVSPGAGDPPGFATFLGLLWRIGIRTPTGQRVVTAILGAVGVVLIGLVAHRLAGRRAGVIAGGLAAIHPMLWINDGMLLSESLYIPMVAITLLAAISFSRSPTIAGGVGLGLATATAAMVRPEAAFWFVAMVPFLAWRHREALAHRVALVGACWAAGALVMVPWLTFNQARFAEPVTLTSGSGSVLLSGSCDDTFDGTVLGYYSLQCLDDEVGARPLSPSPNGEILDESVNETLQRAVAVEFLGDHVGELPKVAAARVGRVWEIYRPGQNVQLNTNFENRGRLPSQLGLLGYYLLLPFSLAGMLLLRQRGEAISIYVAMAAVASVVAAATFGITRYRVPVDVAMVVLTAVAISTVWTSMERRRRAPASTSAQS